jgi:hypothetical protein
MKHILLIALFLVPIFSIAQNEAKIDLTEYGLKASMTNNGVSTIKEIEKGESDFKTLEVKVRFENSNRLTITELKKPLTVPMYVKMSRQALASKNKTVTLKALVNSGTSLLVERTYKEDGRKIYKCMHGIIANGKHYLIDSDEIDEEATARKMLGIAQSFKMNK